SWSSRADQSSSGRPAPQDRRRVVLIDAASVINARSCHSGSSFRASPQTNSAQGEYPPQQFSIRLKLDRFRANPTDLVASANTRYWVRVIRIVVSVFISHLQHSQFRGRGRAAYERCCE